MPIAAEFLPLPASTRWVWSLEQNERAIMAGRARVAASRTPIRDRAKRRHRFARTLGDRHLFAVVNPPSSCHYPAIFFFDVRVGG